MELFDQNEIFAWRYAWDEDGGLILMQEDTLANPIWAKRAIRLRPQGARKLFEILLKAVEEGRC